MPSPAWKESYLAMHSVKAGMSIGRCDQHRIADNVEFLLFLPPIGRCLLYRFAIGESLRSVLGSRADIFTDCRYRFGLNENCFRIKEDVDRNPV